MNGDIPITTADASKGKIRAHDILPPDAIDFGFSLYMADNTHSRPHTRESAQLVITWFQGVVNSFPEHSLERLYLVRLQTAAENLAHGVASRKERYERKITAAHIERELMKKVTTLTVIIGNVSRAAFQALVIGGLFLLLFHSLLGLPDFWQTKGATEPNYHLIITLVGTCMLGIAVKLFSTSRYHNRLLHIKKLEDAALREYRQSVKREYDLCAFKAQAAWESFTQQGYPAIISTRDNVARTFFEQEFLPDDFKNDKAVKFLRVVHMSIRALRLLRVRSRH